MEDEDQKELQLLPAPQSNTTSSSHASAIRPSSSSDSSLLKLRSTGTDPHEGPSLDLQLSTNLIPPIIRPIKEHVHQGVRSDSSTGNGVEALKWQAAEQIWLAAIEKAYAERMRELSRREMELAQSEFAHARSLRERAKEEVEKAEKLKELHATRLRDSTCMEITCHSCRQKFQP